MWLLTAAHCYWGLGKWVDVVLRAVYHITMPSNESPYGDDHIAISCDCHSPDHVFTFQHDAWTGEHPTVYLYVQMNPEYSFWRRLVTAFKYLIGYPTKYGHWHETLVSGNNILRLRDFCDVVVARNVDFILNSRKDNTKS